MRWGERVLAPLSYRTVDIISEHEIHGLFSENERDECKGERGQNPE